VTWTSLLANKEAQKHKTSKKELDNMRALIARDLNFTAVGRQSDRSPLPGTSLPVAVRGGVSGFRSPAFRPVCD
jgi:hypothetical protein